MTEVAYTGGSIRQLSVRCCMSRQLIQFSQFCWCAVNTEVIGSLPIMKYWIATVFDVVYSNHHSSLNLHNSLIVIYIPLTLKFQGYKITNNMQLLGPFIKCCSWILFSNSGVQHFVLKWLNPKFLLAVILRLLVLWTFYHCGLEWANSGWSFVCKPAYKIRLEHCLLLVTVFRKRLFYQENGMEFDDDDNHHHHGDTISSYS
jgi:hypothetical protein